jgi:hypothetical protein
MRRGLLRLCVLAALCGCAEAAAQRIVYVNASATGANNGTSWADAYREVRVALTAAVPDDELWVAAGTYKPTAGMDRTATFSLRSGVALYGGFAGSEANRDERDWATNETVLSGDIGIQGNRNDNTHHVVTATEVDSTAILDGFTVTNGYSAGGAVGLGAGMLNTGASPVVSNCHFLANTGPGGGGMGNRNESHPVVKYTVFTGNDAGTGGGMLSRNASSPTLYGVEFNANVSDSGGGFLAYDASNPICIDCTFVNNTAEEGGAVHSEFNSRPLFVRGVFTGNVATSAGGGAINAEIGADVVCVDCLFSGNRGVVGGAIVALESNPVFVNTLFEGNTALQNVAGAIHIGIGSVARLYNVALTGNRSGLEGGALHATSGWFEAVNVTAAGNRAGPTGQAAGAFLYSPGGSTLDNVVLWGNQGVSVIGGGAVTLRRGIVEGGCTPPMNCEAVSDTDPLFVRPPFTDGPADYGDLRLQAGSPAIDAGLAAYLPADVWDLDEDGDTTEPLPIDILGQARMQGAEVDLGAYEGGVVVAGEPRSSNGAIQLQVSPNPINSRASVTLTLPAAVPAVHVLVLDVLGRDIVVLHSGPLRSGVTRMPVDAGAWRAGVYVVRASGGGVSATRRFTVAH